MGLLDHRGRPRDRPWLPRVSRENSHLRDETVTPSWNRLNEARVVGRIADGATELRNGNVDGLVEVTKTSIGPDAGTQFLPGHDLPRVFQQHFQKLEWLLLNLDPDSSFAQFSGVRVNFVGPKPQDRS